MSALLHDIARAMNGKVSGDRAIFPTPGHSARDRGSWASLAPGAPDGVVIHSANGGDALAIKDELRAKGVLGEREFARRPEPMFRQPRNPGVSHFEFCSADGEVVCRKVRTDLPNGEKTFTWQHPDGKGGWANGRGCDALLYRLPELLAAPADAVIYVAEGERKADHLAKWGFVATSSKDLPDDISAFEGRTVVILPDNDDQGATIADKLQAALSGIAAKVVQIKLPGLPPKGDIIDWAGNGRSAFELQELVDRALAPDLIELDDVADWENLVVPPRRWLLDGWLPVGEGALLTGAGAVGKSLVAQQLAATIAAGQPFMGLPTQQATTIYITCEDSQEEAQRRHCDIARTLPKTIARGACLVKSWRGELDLELAMFDAQRRMRPTKRFESLRQTALATGARFIVLDNTSHLFGGDENVKREVAAFANLLNGLAAEIDGVILLLGHPNKTGLNNPGAGDANQFGGSVTWENGFRSRMFMAVPDTEDPDARELSNPKANYSPKGNKLRFRWHAGAFVRDQDLPADYAAELTATIKATGENGAFLRCLAAATAQKRAVSHNPGSNYAPKVFAAMTEGKGYSEKGFKGAMERLLHLGEIGLDQPLWRGPNRVMKQGIRALEICTDPPARTPCTDLHAPLAETRSKPCTGLHASTPLYPTGTSGAPLGVGAPGDDPFDPRSWEAAE